VVPIIGGADHRPLAKAQVLLFNALAGTIQFEKSHRMGIDWW